MNFICRVSKLITDK